MVRYWTPNSTISWFLISLIVSLIVALGYHTRLKDLKLDNLGETIAFFHLKGVLNKIELEFLQYHKSIAR
jgi:hypothetical protein